MKFGLALRDLYHAFTNNTQFNYEVEMEDMLRSFIQVLNKSDSDSSEGVMFDTSRIKSSGEKSLFGSSFVVKRILPMVEIEGLLFVTNQRIYFQPF